MIRIAALVIAAGAPVWADPAEIVDADASRTGETWRFSVTLRHADTGWDDYADGWRVETPDGEVLATRELLHPHVDEQPFTRAQSGVAVPSGLDRVVIRARTSQTTWDAPTLELSLPR